MLPTDFRGNIEVMLVEFDFSPLNSSALVMDRKVAHFSALNTRKQRQM